MMELAAESCGFTTAATATPTQHTGDTPRHAPTPPQEIGRKENIVGWYHSHPGYGCWLSGIDCSTQMLNQQFQEPFLAVVVDPVRTMASGELRCAGWAGRLGAGWLGGWRLEAGWGHCAAGAPAPARPPAPTPHHPPPLHPHLSTTHHTHPTTTTPAPGKVEIGAFRTYPEGYKPPDEGPSEYQTIPLSKIEDFGVWGAGGWGDGGMGGWRLLCRIEDFSALWLGGWGGGWGWASAGCCAVGGRQGWWSGRGRAGWLRGYCSGAGDLLPSRTSALPRAQCCPAGAPHRAPPAAAAAAAGVHAKQYYSLDITFFKVTGPGAWGLGAVAGPGCQLGCSWGANWGANWCSLRRAGTPTHTQPPAHPPARLRLPNASPNPSPNPGLASSPCRARSTPTCWTCCGTSTGSTLCPPRPSCQTGSLRPARSQTSQVGGRGCGGWRACCWVGACRRPGR